VLANLPDKASGGVDLVFADPPFNWEVPYAGSESGGEGWKDGMPRREYERFTFDWIDGCIDCLAPHGSIFINIPDDTAAECVMHLKRRGLTMINWCIWHFRFGQHRESSFIMSKVHVLYFAKLGNPSPLVFTTESAENTERAKIKTKKSSSVNSVSSVVNQTGIDRIWNPDEILELSDRASIYADPRTMAKDTNKGMRVPMDVWYGKYWGRIQGNNKERRHNHHNQIPEIYLERVIKACSNPGGLVLDPFCGSGTTSTVARALGRRSITIEYSKVNAASAWERITNVGVIKREDADKPQSTAIFKNRRKGTKLSK
jgi:site-specific DNA-methyltransferase (adenine-specific)